MFDGMPTTFNGSYNMTQIALSTAFKPMGAADKNYESQPFNQLLENRQHYLDRLNAMYQGTNYPGTGFMSESDLSGQPYDAANGAFNINSSEVLIPSFIAAYTGRDPKKLDTSPFLSLKNILPNWRASYDGLSRIPG